MSAQGFSIKIPVVRGLLALPRSHWRTGDASIHCRTDPQELSLIRFAGTKIGHSGCAAEILLNVKIWDPSLMPQEKIIAVFTSRKTTTWFNGEGGAN